ncbi:MAG: HAD family hydrolase [Spirochaetota bacterium]
MPDRAVTTIVFDLGRVLVDIFPGPFLDAATRIVGAPEEAFRRRVGELVEPFETGRTPTDEAVAFILETPGGRWEADACSPARRRAARLLVSTLSNRFAPIPETVTLAHALADAGWQLALASNTNPIDFEAIRSSFPDVLDPFGNRLFLSHEMGLMKPDPRYFTAVTRRLGVAPASCVFVDDRADNVAAAGEVGMRSIRYEGPASLMTSLERVIGPLPA